MTAIPQEFITERGGRKFVLYAGLLNEAHNQGLAGIDTELVQVPEADNGNVAIAQATVIMDKLDEFDPQSGRREVTFSGIGDASPDNVSKNIVPHIIRMAETRAKARALRDAINVGMTALEELGEGDGSSAPADRRITREDVVSEVRAAQREASRAANPEGLSRQGQGQDEDERPITKKQLNYLESLVEDGVADREKFIEEVGRPLEEFTRHMASHWIGKLSGKG